MIAIKEVRVQEQAKKQQNMKKEAQDFLIINNDIGNREIFLKHNRDNATNEKPSNKNLNHIVKYTFNNVIPEISKIQIDADCFCLKKPNIKNEKKNNFNSKNNQNGVMQEHSEKMEIVDEDEKLKEKEKQHSSMSTYNHNKSIEQERNEIQNIARLEKELQVKKTPEDRLNDILIRNYGAEFYKFSIELEKLNFCPNNLKKHKFDPEIRTKMIDWMIEVLSAYNSDPQTFSLSVQILDLFIARTQNILTNNDIHLLGVCSMYIASKMEDIIPLRMNHVKSKISHNKFSEKEIKKKEKMILETINFETINTSTYDFIKTFIFDFIHNNRVQVYKLNMFHLIDVFENVAIFLSKLIAHSHEFLNYHIKAIACIVAAFDIMRSNSKGFLKESGDFMRQWILFLINESNCGTNMISDVYNKVVDYYYKYDKIKYISFNLSKTHSLQFY